MFGPLGVTEVIFILVLALLVFGPRRLPELGRTIGRAMGEFRRASTELRRTLNNELALEEEAPRRRPAPPRPKPIEPGDSPAPTPVPAPARGTAARESAGGVAAAGPDAAPADPSTPAEAAAEPTEPPPIPAPPIEPR